MENSSVPDITMIYTSSPETTFISLSLLNAFFYLKYSYSSKCCICFATIVTKAGGGESKRIASSSLCCH